MTSTPLPEHKSIRGYEEKMMSDTVKTIEIHLEESPKDDQLVEAIKFLRVLYWNYSDYLDIAYEAIRREQSLPPEMAMQELK